MAKSQRAMIRWYLRLCRYHISRVICKTFACLQSASGARLSKRDGSGQCELMGIVVYGQPQSGSESNKRHGVLKVGRYE